MIMQIGLDDGDIIIAKYKYLLKCWFEWKLEVTKFQTLDMFV